VKNNQYDPEAGGNGSEGKKYESDAAVDIPDDDPAGVDSEITVTDSILPSRITVAVDISHDYIGDLTVTLKRGGVDVVLHDQEGGWEDNIIREYEVTDAGLLGQEAQGSWVLHITDTSAMDQGTLNSWSITLVP
jgi:subtilisin-like proprotein convertase family protein